jgi:uncharacterized protein YcbX
MALRLTEINRYPVKSCGPVAEQRATVDTCGLLGDRRWMLVDDDGAQLTAREHPEMLRVSVDDSGDGLLLRHPDAEPLGVAVPSGERISVRIWRSTVMAALADDDAHAWLSKVAGVSARLVHLDDTGQRHPNPVFARPDDTVSLADGYPILAATTDSLAALNDLIAEGDRADEGPVSMRRFRPNLVLSGATAWEEDGWRRLRIGDALFRVVKGCDRCVMTVTDPDTGRRGKEPLRKLARHRRFDGLTWFGMNLVPDTPGAVISVGDEAEVLASEPAPDGPPR